MILLLDEPEENFTDFVENLPARLIAMSSAFFISQRLVCVAALFPLLHCKPFKPPSQQTCGDVIPSPAADPRIYIFYQKY